MESKISRIVSGLVGILAILFGASLLLQGDGFDTGPLQGIASLVVALGVAALGAAILPGSIQADGEQIKPLGLSLQATGGFALFVTTLMFLMAFPTEKTNSAQQVPTPQPVQQTQSPTPQPQSVQSTFYEVQTYCSVCCPQGSYNCPATGYSTGSNLQLAIDQAVDQCVYNGGQRYSCVANVQQLSP